MGFRLASAVVAVVVLTAGCTGVLLGDDDIVFESGETLLDNETAAEAGYELQTSDREELNRTAPIDGDDDRHVVIRYHVAMYGPSGASADETEAVGIGLLTTPDAKIAGQSVNPLLRTDNYERIFQLFSERDGGNLEEHDNYTVEPFDESVTVTVLAAQFETNGEPEAFVHIMQAEASDDDVVIAYAIHPADVYEREAIARLFSSLEYTPADELSPR